MEFAARRGSALLDEDKNIAGERKMDRDLNVQIGSLGRVALISFLGLAVLTGCVSPRQIQKTRDDAAIYGEQQRAREVRERCMDRGAMPGTTAYLECQMKSAK